MPLPIELCSVVKFSALSAGFLSDLRGQELLNPEAVEKFAEIAERTQPPHQVLALTPLPAGPRQTSHRRCWLPHTAVHQVRK